ncbi:hypothetical protein [Streptomyces mirabilis]|uniref:hypothetical protein n=1 Tax=Streptomyces mirabilis TaxID=68239 RepID=UPI00331D40DD
MTAMGSPCSPTARYMIRIARELTLCRRVDTVIGSDAKRCPGDDRSSVLRLGYR